MTETLIFKHSFGNVGWGQQKIGVVKGRWCYFLSRGRGAIGRQGGGGEILRRPKNCPPQTNPYLLKIPPQEIIAPFRPLPCLWKDNFSLIKAWNFAKNSKKFKFSLKKLLFSLKFAKNLKSCFLGDFFHFFSEYIWTFCNFFELTPLSPSN